METQHAVVTCRFDEGKDTGECRATLISIRRLFPKLLSVSTDLPRIRSLPIVFARLTCNRDCSKLEHRDSNDNRMSNDAQRRRQMMQASLESDSQA